MDRVLIAGGGTEDTSFRDSPSPGAEGASSRTGDPVRGDFPRPGVEGRPREGYELKLLPVRGCPEVRKGPGRRCAGSSCGAFSSCGSSTGSGGRTSSWHRRLRERARGHRGALAADSHRAPGAERGAGGREPLAVRIADEGSHQLRRRSPPLPAPRQPPADRQSAPPRPPERNRQLAFKRLGCPRRQTVFRPGREPGGVVDQPGDRRRHRPAVRGVEAAIPAPDREGRLAAVRSRVEGSPFPITVIPFIKNMDEPTRWPV